MITDGILQAVQAMIDKFQKADEIGAAKMIWEMLSDYDEDKWYLMTNEERITWIKNYIN